MNNMELAYMKFLNETYNEVKQELCGDSDGYDLEYRVVEAKNNLMLADQETTADINVIDIQIWNACAQRLKTALQNVFRNIVNVYYEDNKNDNKVNSLFKAIVKVPEHNCRDKNSPYMAENYPNFFKNYQKFKNNRRNKSQKETIKEDFDNYLKQIEVIALMERLIELKDKIYDLQNELYNSNKSITELKTEKNHIPLLLSENQDELLNTVIKSYNKLPKKNKEQFVNILLNKTMNE